MKNLWEKIKAWWNLTAIPWLKKSWMQIVNIIVMFIAYGNTDSLPGVQTVLGIWLFLLLGYYIFWKLLGAEKIFIKKDKPLQDPLTFGDMPHPKQPKRRAPRAKVRE